MRLLVQFFAPEGSEIPLLRRLRDLVEKESMSDYNKVKRILVKEFGTETYQKYRKDVQMELQKQFRTEYVPDETGTYGSSTNDIEEAEKKLAVLDYVSNPFKIVGTIGRIPDVMLSGTQGKKYKELASCKFHGTLMKTNSKFKEWERRWCRIPKEGGVMRRSGTHPFHASFWDLTRKTKEIPLKNAVVQMGRTLWNEEVKKSGKVGRLKWPPTPYWFKLIQPDKKVGNNVWYFCTSSKAKLHEWVRVLQREIYESSPMRDLMIGDADGSSKEENGGSSIPHDDEEKAFNASCNALSTLLSRVQSMSTVEEASDVLGKIIKECESCGAFEIDAIVEEVYESISSNENYDKIKSDDNKGIVVSFFFFLILSVSFNVHDVTPNV